MNSRTRNSCTRNSRPARMLAGLLLLSGCTLAVDPGLITADDAGPAKDDPVEERGPIHREDDAGPPRPTVEPPEPELDAGAPQADASVEFDAQTPVLDASVDANHVIGPEVDAGVRDAQGPDLPDVVMPLIVDARVVCTRDTDCASDSFCSTSGGCIARDDAQRGRVGPRAPVEAVTGYALVADMVYWSTLPETDTLGNRLNYGDLWSGRSADPTTQVVQRDTGTLLFVIDDYAYSRRSATLNAEPLTVLLRKKLGTPDSPLEQLATGVDKVWKTRDHVVWTHKEGVFYELWRLKRTPGSSPERALQTTDGPWASSNATFAINLVAYPPAQPDYPMDYRFVIVRIADQVQYGSVYHGDNLWNENAAADEDYFYFTRVNQIIRVPFSDLSQEIILANGLMPQSIRFEPSGGWVYWNGYGSSSDQSGRTQRDALVPPQPLPLMTPGVGVYKNERIYVDSNENRFFFQTMPPLPCSSAMPCPEHMSCGSSMFCE